MGNRIVIEHADGAISVADVVLVEGQTLEDVAPTITPDGATWRIATDEEAQAQAAAAPVPDSSRILTRPQFAFLLAITGFSEVWDGLEALLKDTDRPQYAALVAERSRDRFRLDRTLAIVAEFRATAAQIAPDVDLSDTAIRVAWEQAEQVNGIDGKH